MNGYSRMNYCTFSPEKSTPTTQIISLKETFQPSNKPIWNVQNLESALDLRRKTALKLPTRQRSIYYP
jgi:hypothetical protein